MLQHCFSRAGVMIIVRIECLELIEVEIGAIKGEDDRQLWVLLLGLLKGPAGVVQVHLGGHDHDHGAAQALLSGSALEQCNGSWRSA